MAARPMSGYLRFVAHHSLTASVAVFSPPSAAPRHAPHHQTLCTPALVHSCSAESLGRGPFTRNSVNGSAQGSAQGSVQQGKKSRRLQWERHYITSRLRWETASTVPDAAAAAAAAVCNWCSSSSSRHVADTARTAPVAAAATVVWQMSAEAATAAAAA